MSRRSGASRSRPAALFLSPEPPYPVIGGGPLRTASLLEYAASRYLVDLIVFRQPGSPDPASAVPDGLLRRVAAIPLPRHSKALPAWVARNARRLLAGVPPLVDRFAGFEREIERLLAGTVYDVAIIEHSWCAPYAGTLAAIADRLVLDLHNIESVLLDRSANEETRVRAAALRRFSRRSRLLERKFFPQMTLLLASSPEDAGRARDLAGGADVLVYPNAIPWRARPRAAKRASIVFTGNMEYHPNRLAIRYFHRKIWPIIRDRHQDLRWELIGMNAQSALEEVNGSPRVKAAGEVEDAIAAIAGARAAVVPVLAGSGTRFKIIEAWAAGVPVISTTVGAEGLPGVPGEHLLIADSAEDFAGAVCRVLEDPCLASRLGSSGRRLYEAKLTWEKAWDHLKGSVLDVPLY